MSGVEFSFQDTGAGDSSGSRAWIAIAVFVTLATVGVILLVRAFGEKDGAKDEAGQPAAEETAGGGAHEEAPPPSAMRESWEARRRSSLRETSASSSSSRSPSMIRSSE